MYVMYMPLFQTSVSVRNSKHGGRAHMGSAVIKLYSIFSAIN